MTRVLHLGDLEFAIPLSAGLGTWLLAAGAWRTALRWGACFGAAALLVGATKIAHLGWGAALPLPEFKALSGHATVVTALYPFAAWVLLVRHHRPAAQAALAGGLLLGAFVAVLLVAKGEHSSLEAVAGWLLGALVSVSAVAWSRDLERARLLSGIWWSLPVFALVFALMDSAHIGYWMIKLALALSGNSRPYPWDAGSQACFE